MSEYDLERRSRPVIVSAYDPHWPKRFEEIGTRIRRSAGARALRIDHIGSTAVPGLGAKDAIDIQITVADLEACAELTAELRAGGFREGDAVLYDLFHGMAECDPELRKLRMREPAGEPRAILHIREQGRFNQRYALLFRDYLRAAPRVRAEYELAKQRAAQLFPESIDGYLFLKEPVFHLIYEAASLWAEREGWAPDTEHL
jgi:GrpB-like predicted nucleotidyltransferase (UPF0157 family)